jgi:septum formation inhibitor-activating ATPase MinD
MIKLNLAIYDGAVEVINFNTQNELCEYLQELKMFDCIWLATDDGENGEILITENLQTLINAVKNSHFNLLCDSPQNFFVQEYQTYEDAYKVALDMRETNPRCYEQED